MSTQTTPAVPHVSAKPLRIASRVTAGLVSTQLVLIIGDIVGFTALGLYHGMVGYLSLTSAIVTMVLALLERPRGLERGPTLVASALPVMMCIQLFLSTVAVRGPHMFLGGLILLTSWVVVMLVAGTPRASDTAGDDQIS